MPDDGLGKKDYKPVPAAPPPELGNVDTSTRDIKFESVLKKGIPELKEQAEWLHREMFGQVPDGVLEPEPPPPVETEALPKPGFTGPNSRTPRVGQGVSNAGPFVFPKGAGANAVMVAEITPGMSEAEQASIAKSKDAVLKGTFLQGLEYVKHARVTEAELRGFAELQAINAEAVARMVKEDFPKYKTKMQEFQREIEDIRTMKVNPYQYLQSIGGGGRAGAVLATAVAQMAAGAGNVNTARKALQSAIGLDIETQIANIDLAFRGAETAQANVMNQIAIQEEELLFRDKMAAYAWEAVNSVIEASKHGAQAEASLIGLNLLGHYANIERIQSAVAVRAKLGTIHVRAPIRNELQAARQAQQNKQYQDVLQMSLAEGANLGYRKAQAEFQAGGGGRSPSVKSRRQGQAQGNAQGQMQGEAGMPAYGSPEFQTAVEEGSKPGGTHFFSPEDGEQYMWDMVKDIPVINTSKGPQDLRREIMSVGGWDRHAAANARTGLIGDVPRFKDQANKLINDFENYYGSGLEARTPQTARALAGLLREKVLPAVQPGRMRQKLEYAIKYPELLESNVPIDVDGKNSVNTVETNLFGDLRLRYGKIRDETSLQYKNLEEEIRTAETGIKKLESAASLVKETTIGSLLGLKMTDGEWHFDMLDNETRANVIQLQTNLTSLGVEWIKGHDPSGRLSDQDIKLAHKMVAAAQGGFALKMDVLQTMWRGGDLSAVRESMIRLYRVMAANKFQKFIDGNKNKFVATFDSWEKSKEKWDEVSNWLLIRAKEDRRTDRYGNKYSGYRGD